MGFEHRRAKNDSKGAQSGKSKEELIRMLKQRLARRKDLREMKHASSVDEDKQQSLVGDDASNTENDENEDEGEGEVESSIRNHQCFC